METIERIQKMEQALDSIESAKNELVAALESFSAKQDQLMELSGYYGSEVFFHDLSMDEQGLLPKELKRGVLSEDAVYDLITSVRKMAVEMQKLSETVLKSV